MRKIRATLLVVLGLATLVAAVAAPASRRDVTLNLVAYSTPKEAYAKIIPAFQARPDGKGINFNQSYAGSGDQSRAVENGLPADVVEFSNEPDVTRLVKDGLVSKGWNHGPYHGYVTDSVVVFVLRDGNPKHIHTWDDLTKSGIQVITPDPFQSGGGQWNVMAAYGAERFAGKTDKQAIDYLGSLFKNVAVQDKSARDALQTFLSGKGDVLLTYENEAILAKQKGQAVQYIIPKSTILIENPAAVISKSSHQAEAKAFLRFLYTPAAQTIFAQNGYRPVVSSVRARFSFPKRPGIFTIKNFGVGGWDKAATRFFDPNNGIMVKVERSAHG